MSSKLRAAYDRAFAKIQDDILKMGNMVDQAIHQSVEALKNRDQVLAQEVIDADEEINALRFAVEEAVLALIATQQPAASDLRAVVAAMNIVVEMERMADHASGIAKRQIPLAIANSFFGNHMLSDFEILGAIVAVPIPTKNIHTTSPLALSMIPRKAPATATTNIAPLKAHRDPKRSVKAPPTGEKRIEGRVSIPIISPIWVLVSGISAPISVNSGGIHCMPMKPIKIFKKRSASTSQRKLLFWSSMLIV